MQTKPKANSTITHIRNEDGTLTFTVLGAGSFTFDPSKAHANNRARAEVHGWLQRISDGGALSREPKTGKPATPADKMARMRAIADHYQSGAAEWGLRAAPRTPKRDDTLLMAIANAQHAAGKRGWARPDDPATPLGVGETHAKLAGIATAQGVDVDALIAALVAQRADIRAERDRLLSLAAPAGIDADALLDEVDGEE